MPATWPNKVEYSDAVQAPSHCFQDPDLRAGETVVDALGLPAPCSGGFAVVYQVRSADRQKSWAVKCFTKSVPGLKERYWEISQHLLQARLPLAVEVKYLEEGILVRGTWFPVVKMDWVEGLTLRQFVLNNLHKPRQLEALYQVWLKVEPLLAEANVAHGDLQHGDVLLVSGQREEAVSLRLIDYDGMWVPALDGQPPPEAGHPAYRHPKRAERDVYTADMDRFPHLVVACALKCLACGDGPALWRKFDDGDNLLFKKEDFQSPGNSDLLQRIWTSGNEELRAWAGLVAIAADSPLEATPPLSYLLVNGTLPPLSGIDDLQARRIMDEPSPAQPPTSLARDAVRATEAVQASVPSAGGAADQLKETAGPRTARSGSGAEGPEAPQPPAARSRVRRVSRRIGHRGAFSAALALPIIIGGFLFARIYLMAPTPAAPERQGNTGGGAALAETQSAPEFAGEENTLVEAELPPILRKVASWQPGGGPIGALALSPDGRRVAIYQRQAASGDRISLWNADDGTKLPPAELNVVPIPLTQPAEPGLCFTADGKVVAASAAARDGLRQPFNTNVPGAARLARTGRWLLAADEQGTIVELWDLDGVRRVRVYPGPQTPILAISFRGPVACAVATSSGEVIEYDLSSGLERQRFSLQKSGKPALQQVGFSADGRKLLDYAADQQSSVWDVVNGTRLRILTAVPSGGLLLPDGRRLVYWPSPEKCVAADALTGAIVAELNDPEAPATATDGNSLLRAEFSQETGRFVSCSGSRTVHVFEMGGLYAVPAAATADLWYGTPPRSHATATGATEKVWQLTARLRDGVAAGSQYCDAFPDGSRMLSINSARKLAIISLKTVERKEFLEAVLAARISPSGDRLAIVAANEAPGMAAESYLRVYDTTTWEMLLSAALPEPKITLAFSPDGSEVAALGSDGNNVLVAEARKAGGRRDVSLPKLATTELDLGGKLAFRWDQTDEWLLFTSNGELLAIHPRTGDLKRRFIVTPRGWEWVVFSEDGELALSQSGRQPIQPEPSPKQRLELFETRHGSLRSALEVSAMRVNAALIAPDKSCALLCSQEDGLLHWDLRSPATEKVKFDGFSYRSALEQLVMWPGRESGLVRDASGAIYAWEVEGISLRQLPPPRAAAASVGQSSQIAGIEPSVTEAAPPAIAAQHDRVPLEAAWLIFKSVNGIVRTDPKVTISRDGVALDEAQLRALQVVDNERVRGATYQLFAYPNRFPLRVTWTGTGRPTFRTWQNREFAPLQLAPVGSGRKTVALPMNVPSNEPTVYLMLVDADGGGVETDLIEAQSTGVQPPATAAVSPALSTPAAAAGAPSVRKPNKIKSITHLAGDFTPFVAGNSIIVPAKAAAKWIGGDRVRIGKVTFTVEQVNHAGKGIRFDKIALKERPTRIFAKGMPVEYLGAE